MSFDIIINDEIETYELITYEIKFEYENLEILNNGTEFELEELLKMYKEEAE